MITIVVLFEFSCYIESCNYEIWLTQAFMMMSSNGSIFHVTGPLCGEFISDQWIPCTKASDKELWCFSLICTSIYGWVNNSEVGDLRCHHAHYDIIVMLLSVTGHIILNNSLVRGKCGINFKSMIFKSIIQNDSWVPCCKIALRLMPKNFTNEKSTMVRVMAWSCQATSHYLINIDLCCHRLSLCHNISPSGKMAEKMLIINLSGISSMKIG